MGLSDLKTRNETGLDFVMNSINVLTPFGKRRLKELNPFLPGQEDKLEYEFHKLEEIIRLTDEKPRLSKLLIETFMDIKDISFTIERSRGNALSVVELFEVKSLLLKMNKIIGLLGTVGFPLSKEFILEDTTDLLNILDPRKDRMAAFYIYDDFSEKLRELRKKKRKQEHIINNEKKTYENNLSMIFTVKRKEEIDSAKRELNRLNETIEEQELLIREELSKSVGYFSQILQKNCDKIGELDFTLSKAIYAIQHHCVRPQLIKEHRIKIDDGRHLGLEEVLNQKDQHYCPVSIHLDCGVTCVTGANMGGKTISLKLVGLVAMLTQYGFYVPCREAQIGLSNYIRILTGDNQSIQRGLSSFGSEMEELKKLLDNSKERSLLLIDEVASATNPVEGFALTKSIVEYLKKRPYISLITTHFDGVAEGEGIINMQVIGLANVDLGKLEKELRYANHSERIGIISKHMDYRLYNAKDDKVIPKDALNIAKALGIDDEIIENARKYVT